MTMPELALPKENCRCCGESVTDSCPDCGEPECPDCIVGQECSTVLCVACGHPVNHDWDMVFDLEGGGLHRRCD